MKATKKPLTINCYQWDGKDETLEKIARWNSRQNIGYHKKEELEIDTLEGRMIAHIGDWIVKGIKGEVYPVRKDIFEQTYHLDKEGGKN